MIEQIWLLFEKTNYAVNVCTPIGLNGGLVEAELYATNEGAR